METSELIQTVAAMHGEASRRGVFFQQTTDEHLRDRTVTVAQQQLVSFASCSYLGLEHHPALVAAVHEAVDRYGTQFSASRGYLSAPCYDELESLLGEVFGGHVLVTPSTTMAHMVAMPLLANERDTIVLDHQAHHSMHMAAALARAGGARIEVLRHGVLDRAIDRITELARSCRTLWLVCDGVYSMFGDLAPVHLLRHLLAGVPNLRLYVDDAHGMSWAGTHGRGSFLSRMPLDERIVLASSLNKAFSAGGGCLVFPSAKARDHARMCGAPMVFSGPLQPPMLHAAIASARVHLSPEITERQHALAARVAHANTALRASGAPLLSANESPIFFVGLGVPELAFTVVERMRDDGFYVCASVYPAVPMKLAGIRLTLTAGHSFAEIDAVVARLATHVADVLEQHGVDRDELAARFEQALPTESRRISTATLLRATPTSVTQLRVVERTQLRVETHTSITAIDPAVWDPLMGNRGLTDHATLRALESVFIAGDRREHEWGFRYVVVHDGDTPVLATVLTTALLKDDMLMRREVSERVELRRVDDPYFLSSLGVMMGSLLSEGRHLHVDRTGPWREAMLAMLEIADRDYEQRAAGVLVLRDLPDDDDEMDALVLARGLVKVPMPDSHVLDVSVPMPEYAQSLGRRKRMHLRRNEELAAWYDVRVHASGHLPPPCDAELAQLYTLYANVADRGLRLNVFRLPEVLLGALARCPSWEIVTLRLLPAHGGPADGTPVAFFAAHRFGDVYSGFLCGIDYRYVTDHGVYRQVLHQAMLRARANGSRSLRLGMGADIEKRRLGTAVETNCAYVHARDDFGGVVLREIAAEAAWIAC